VYFEANGHGTVLFKDSFLASLETHMHDQERQAFTQRSRACQKLVSFSRLLNPYVGDALADLLAIESILWNMNMSIGQWDSLYEPLPNKMVKIRVSDRSRFKTMDAERILIEPVGVQAQMDALLDRSSLERATVR
jgi:phosphoacetylglucosamine mutase